MCREDSASICVPGRPPPSQNDDLQSSREGQTGLGGMMLLFWPALMQTAVLSWGEVHALSHDI